MTLTASDYSNIASLIEEGTDTIEYTKGGEVLCIDYTLEIDGYVEDDYYNGTGAFVETSVDFYIESADSYTEDGEETDNDFDEDELYKIVA